LQIVALTAHDPFNTDVVYHNGVQIAVLFNQIPTWKKQLIYHGLSMTKDDINELFTFDAVLGVGYIGQWIVYDACPEEIYSLNPPFPGPACRGALITVTNILGNVSLAQCPLSIKPKFPNPTSSAMSVSPKHSPLLHLGI